MTSEEFVTLNIVFPALLGVQLILLIISAISRKESMFLATVIFSCICVMCIRLGVPTGGYMLSGLDRSLFVFFMPWLFRIVDALTFAVCITVKTKANFQRSWSKVFRRYAFFSLGLDAICLMAALF